MEKGKRLEAEFQLPEAIIQHIQSFLNAKEAAQTTLLSKSWYGAWLTRPNLDFDHEHFIRISNHTERGDIRFWKFVEKTVKRYEKLNLKIDSFRLWVRYLYTPDHCSYSRVHKLIKKALEMGARVIDFKIVYADRRYILPQEVFGSETLVSLSVSGCKIGKWADGKVSCSRLKSLTLENVYVESDIIWDIISICPLLENLSLLILSPFTVFGSKNVVDFHKLKHLLLSRVDVDALFFDDFSSKFPRLEDLAIQHCHGYGVIQLSSPSLECIKFTQDKIFRARFNVPNLRKFTFSGTRVPSLLFKRTTSNWESDISIKRQYPPTGKWFLELNKLLKKLSVSRVSLSLEFLSENTLDCDGNIQGLPKPEVENLTINGPYSVCPALFCSLFQCCRPIYVTQYWIPKYRNAGKKANDMMEFVYKKMMQQVGLDCCIAYQRMSGEHDLEEVSVEFYDESVSAWRPRLLDTSPADEQRIRLRLKWGR